MLDDSSIVAFLFLTTYSFLPLMQTRRNEQLRYILVAIGYIHRAARNQHKRLRTYEMWEAEMSEAHGGQVSWDAAIGSSKTAHSLFDPSIHNRVNLLLRMLVSYTRNIHRTHQGYQREKETSNRG